MWVFAASAVIGGCLTVASTVPFAGYNWTVRTGAGGPGPNEWSADAVAVDATGALHLSIFEASQKWQCAEVYLESSLGYGTYEWTVTTNVTDMDPSVVLGLFTYEDDSHELDCEFSQWAGGTGVNADFAVQPSSVKANLHNYEVPAAVADLRVGFSWTPGVTIFSAASTGGVSPWSESWSRNGSAVPQAGKEAVHMNLWLFRGAAPKAGIEVVVSGFSFVPAAAALIASVDAAPAAAAASAVADVVVYGSTPGGIAAAIAASRGGAAVTLMDPSPRLGGMMSGGLGSTDRGDTYAIGGIAREFFVAVARTYNASATQPLYDLEPHVAEAAFYALLADANVTVVRTAGPVVRIARRAGAGSTAIANLTTSDGQTFAAAVFVDGSYEGDLVRLSAAHTFGREGRDTYGEAWAGRKEPFSGPFDFRPLHPLDAQGRLQPLLTTRLSAPLGAGDDRVQGYNFRLCVTTEAANRLPFPAPAPYDPARWALLRQLAAFTAPDFARFVGLAALPSGKYDMNNGCLISTDATGLQYGYPNATAAGRAAIADAHRQLMLELFHVLQTDAGVPAALRASASAWGLCADEFTSAPTRGWPEQLYVREASRLVGHRVLVQHDLWPATDFGNASVGMGSYAADGHYSTRGPCVVAPGNASCAMVTSEEQLQAAAAAGTLWTGGEGYVGDTNGFALYQIPYWALLPARTDATNLLAPLTPSASHVTFASLRVEPQFMIMGQAAGTAAALAAAAGVAVQDVPLADLRAQLVAGSAVLCKQGAPACDGSTGGA